LAEIAPSNFRGHDFVVRQQKAWFLLATLLHSEYGSRRSQGRMPADVRDQKRHLVPGIAEQPSFDHPVRATGTNGKRGEG
jgi:hypothetical protein